LLFALALTRIGTIRKAFGNLKLPAFDELERPALDFLARRRFFWTMNVSRFIAMSRRCGPGS
jgi:hypothetical protein